MRISKKLYSDIVKVVRNYNAKVRRLEKSGKEGISIPRRVSTMELTSLEDSKAIRRRINSLKRFSKKGSEAQYILENGEIISNWELKEFKLERRLAKAKLTKELKRFETEKPNIYGKKQVTTYARMGDVDYLKTKARRERLNKPIPSTKKDFYKVNAYYTYILNDRTTNFRNNYYTMFKDTAYAWGINQDKVDEVLAKLDKLSDKDFMKLFNDDKAMQGVIFYYDAYKDGIEPLYNTQVADLIDTIYERIDYMIEQSLNNEEV